ncbi:MAG: NADH-quinone oxidoreductase subunit L [Vicinamibacteria bacterium]|nr:NADH-quinone oxidoreductase subunit L [Vicinamibacteria bacterium]
MPQGLPTGALEDALLMRAPFWVLVFPLVGFIVLALFGDAMKREGKSNWGGYIASAMALASFACAALSVSRLMTLLPGEQGLRFAQPYLGFEWIDVADFRVPLNLLVDPLSAVMILVVTGIGSLIHIYSIGYMHEDEDRVRFFSYLNLFLFFMLVLVLGGSLPLMFVGWEGVGLCSYLLIGFWYKKQSASDAGKKAFVVNRIGDAGLILGMVMAFTWFGTLDLVELAENAGSKPAEGWLVFGPLTLVALALFVGACGKSAQIPLHVWLPDAMEGPTPVSALIHAATMVTAGVYMVCRLAPIYSQSETAMAVVAGLGCATAVIAATIALVQTDIKKVLAYSTVSQLGYMFLAAGVGAFGVAIFHLVTHAFFKALLFLGSGSVIHAMHHEQDMRKMGGLRKHIPWTHWTFAIGTAAIAGVPFLSGFYSKDAILAAAHHHHHTLLFGLGLATALMTAFYMSRLYFLTFWGEFRGGHEAEHHLHESPWSMVGVLVVLAVGAIFGGYIPIPAIVAPVFRLPIVEEAHDLLVPVLATSAGLLGIAAAWYAYVKQPDLPAKVAASARGLQRVLEAKWGFDLAFDWFSSKVVVAGSDSLLWKRVDAGLIDGAVNGAGSVVDAISRGARGFQTGLVRGYALVIFGGAVLLLSYLLWI